MRIPRLFLIGLIPVFSLMAQELSKEPSKFDIQIEEAPRPSVNTNKTPSAFSLMELEVPEESPGLQIQLEEEFSAGPETNAIGSAAVSSAEQLLADKLSFLVGAAIQYSDEGEYEEAERAYLRALEAAPDNETLRFRLSTLYILMKRHVDAVPILEELAVKYVDDSQVHNNLAWCYATGVGVKNKKLALRHARDALLLNPVSPSVWNTLAEAYYVGGDYKRALRSSLRAIELLGLYKNQDSMEEFQAQHLKIQRATEVSKMIEGLGKEE